jgi:toxoflavin synthase
MTNNKINKDQYESQAKKYNFLREGLHQKYVKRPSIEKVIKNKLNKKKVLDLACGEGEFSRFLEKKGAIVTGLDISKELIKIAKEKNKTYDTNIKYHIGNAFNFENIKDRFDVITGVYFLNYASSKANLKQFFKLAKNHLIKNGKMIFLVPNYDFRKYYFNYGIESFTPDKEGQKLKFNIFDDDGSLKLKLECYYWKTKTYEEIFTESGFDFKEHPLIISTAGIKKYKTKFWKEILKNPIFKIYELKLKN